MFYLFNILNILKRMSSNENVKRSFELTDRELQVLNLICQGMTTKEISTSLFLSEHTVRSHIKSAHKKLNTYSMINLYRVCIESKIVTIATPNPSDNSIE